MLKTDGVPKWSLDFVLVFLISPWSWVLHYLFNPFVFIVYEILGC